MGPTRECLAATIAGLARRYVEEGIAPDAYGINDGSCEDFAGEVIESLGGERDGFEAWWGDNLSVGGAGCAWDVALLARLFPASAPTHGLSWDEAAMSVPAHCWIALDGRHYDAECPDGVGNLFELPIVRREMERLATERDAAPVPGP